MQLHWWPVLLQHNYSCPWNCCLWQLHHHSTQYPLFHFYQHLLILQSHSWSPLIFMSRNSFFDILSFALWFLCLMFDLNPYFLQFKYMIAKVKSILTIVSAYYRTKLIISFVSIQDWIVLLSQPFLLQWTYWKLHGNHVGLLGLLCNFFIANQMTVLLTLEDYYHVFYRSFLYLHCVFCDKPTERDDLFYGLPDSSKTLEMILKLWICIPALQ